MNQFTLLQQLKTLNFDLVPNLIQMGLCLMEGRINHAADLLIRTPGLWSLTSLNRPALHLPGSHRLNGSHEVIQIKAFVSGI